MREAFLTGVKLTLARDGRLLPKSSVSVVGVVYFHVQPSWIVILKHLRYERKRPRLKI